MAGRVADAAGFCYGESRNKRNQEGAGKSRSAAIITTEWGIGLGPRR